MSKEIYEKLNLIAVGPTDAILPSLEFVSEILGKHLGVIGMRRSTRRSEVTSDFIPRERNEEDLRYFPGILQDSDVDILGLYSAGSSKPEITLYIDSCVGASKDLAISLDSLVCIVLIHELAHHATASAVITSNGKKYEWDGYSDCKGGRWSDIHEFFAQALAFVCIKQHHESLLDAFRTLSRNQHSVYRTWEILDALMLNGVSCGSICNSLRSQHLVLLKTRYQVPEIETMHTMVGYDE